MKNRLFLFIFICTITLIFSRIAYQRIRYDIEQVKFADKLLLESNKLLESNQVKLALESYQQLNYTEIKNRNSIIINLYRMYYKKDRPNIAIINSLVTQLTEITSEEKLINSISDMSDDEYRLLKKYGSVKKSYYDDPKVNKVFLYYLINSYKKNPNYYAKLRTKFIKTKEIQKEKQITEYMNSVEYLSMIVDSTLKSGSLLDYINALMKRAQKYISINEHAQAVNDYNKAEEKGLSFVKEIETELNNGDISRYDYLRWSGSVLQKLADFRHLVGIKDKVER